MDASMSFISLFSVVGVFLIIKLNKVTLSVSNVIFRDFLSKLLR